MIDWKVGDRVKIREYTEYWTEDNSDPDNPTDVYGTIVSISDGGLDMPIHVEWDVGTHPANNNYYEWYHLVSAHEPSWFSVVMDSGVILKNMEGDVCAYFCGNKRVNISSIVRRCDNNPTILAGLAAALMDAAETLDGNEAQ